jgi:anti-anti-sigma factor
VDAAKTFELDRQPTHARLALAADLNAFHWDDLQRSAQEIIGELEKGSDRTLIVDLTRLDYLGSAQLTLLVRIWKLIKGRDGRMIVELKGPVVREVLKTAGLLNVWEAVDSPDAAFRLLGLQTDGRPKMSGVFPLIGLAALVVACAGIGVSLLRPHAVDRTVLLATELAASAIALGAGLWTAIRGAGLRRGLGAGMVVAGALVAVAAVFAQPAHSASSAPATADHPDHAKATKHDKKGTGGKQHVRGAKQD